jgi:hypothetical protein
MHQGRLNETSDAIFYVLSGCILLLGERIQLLRRSVRLFEFSLIPESTHNFSLKYRQWPEPTSFRHCRACLQGRWKRWDEKEGCPASEGFVCHSPNTTYYCGSSYRESRVPGSLVQGVHAKIWGYLRTPGRGVSSEVLE